jgi:hypothetical protein
MKNIKILTLLPLLALGALAACGPTSTSSSTPKPGSSFSDPGFDEPEPELNQTYNFYIDFSHTDEPFHTMKWYSGKVLGECPAECLITSEDCPDEAFPTFLGWSEFPSTTDETKLWDFEKDAKVALTVNLYGIWVSE